MKTDASQKSASDARNQQILAAQSQQKATQVITVTTQQTPASPAAVKKLAGQKMGVQGQILPGGTVSKSPKPRGRPSKKTEPG